VTTGYLARSRCLPAAVLCLLGLACVLPARVVAQTAPAPGPAAGAPATPLAGTLRTPAVVAIGGTIRATSAGLPFPVRAQALRGTVWRSVGVAAAGPEAVLRVRAPGRAGLLRLRARGADGSVSGVRRIRVRALTLAAVGDVNLGDRPGDLMARFGYGYPWASVGATLRRADLSLANLECAVTRRGRAQAKQYVFRGRPEALRAMRAQAGIDVVNLANNHTGDFGDRGLLDTLRAVRSVGMTPVGAGTTEAAAYRPRVVQRLGLRVAFVGFSTTLPFEFRAVGGNPGTAWGFADRVRQSVRRARRSADVVVATFHWGLELAPREAARERALAQVALRAGATAVIGAHPHVLQPVRRPAGRLVAPSLGNFVFGAGTRATATTGILIAELGRGRVMGARLLPAVIRATRPVLRERP